MKMNTRTSNLTLPIVALLTVILYPGCGGKQLPLKDKLIGTWTLDRQSAPPGKEMLFQMMEYERTFSDNKIQTTMKVGGQGGSDESTYVIKNQTDNKLILEITEVTGEKSEQIIELGNDKLIIYGGKNKDNLVLKRKIGQTNNRQTESAPSANATRLDSSTGSQQQITLAKGGVSFIPPTDYTDVTKRRDGLTYSYVSRTGITVSISLSDQNLLPEDLPRMKGYFEDTLPKIHYQLKWMARDIITMNGQKWIKFEYSDQEDNKTTINEEYYTSVDGRMFIFQTTCEDSLYSTVRDYLAGVRNSIVIQH